MTPGQTALLSALARGHAQAIDNSTFRSEWLDADPELKEVVSESIGMARENKPFSLVNLMARCRKVHKTRWMEITSALKASDGADWRVAVERIKHEFLIDKVRRTRDEMSAMLDTRPGEVEAWLPSITDSLTYTVQAGVNYDSRFKTIIGKEVPQIKFKSLIYGMDDILRGGYRSTFFLLYAAPSKHGKTTTLRSHIVDCLLQKKRVSAINGENLEQIMAALVIVGLSGLPRDEVESKKFTTDHNRKAYHQWVEYVGEYLKIYDWRWLNTDRLQRIATWDRSDVLVIDYLKKQPDMFSDRKNHDDPVGDMGEYLKTQIAQESGLVVLSAGQIAGEASKKLIRSREPSDVQPVYGSARVHFACDEYIFLRRAPQAPDVAEFRVWLDRFAGRLDSVHNLVLNKDTITLEMETSLDAKQAREGGDKEPNLLPSGIPDVPEQYVPAEELDLPSAVQGALI